MQSVLDQLTASGRVKYGERAFQQDTHEAMRGDIVRGLIELITNADDAYARLGDVLGKIRVEVEHRRGSEWQVVVRDRAAGMSQAEMTLRIAELGGRSSGFEVGQAVRGNLGRGTKDLSAFGPTLYESITNDQYAALQLLSSGDYRALGRPRRASSEDRERLGIPRGNGTVVTVTVRASVRCPNHSSLKQKLSMHFQLRDIMSDPKREVLLVSLNSGEQDRLRYPIATSSVIKSVDLVLPGYGDVKATLEVRRLPERCEDPASDPYRPVGILVKGRRAIYENTLFSFEGNPYAALVHGRLECDYIDALAREYDDRQSRKLRPTESNPMPILSRARDGLRHEHPFWLSLRTAAEAVVEEIVRTEEERARQEAARMENEHTRRNLDRLAREAARFMEDELRNAEAEELPPGRGNDEAKPLAIIPGEAICYLDEMRTLTLIARREGLPTEAVVNISLDPEGVVELVDGEHVLLHPHRRRPDLFVGQVHLQPLVADITLIQAEIDSRVAEALVEVRDMREERAVPPPPEPPTTLEFERPRYRIGWMKRKTVALKAPIGLCEPGEAVKVSSNASGVVVLTGRVPMRVQPHEGYLYAEVKIEGRALGAEAEIAALVKGIEATCHAVVTRDGEGPTLRFTLEDKDGGKYRALWEEQDDPKTGERTKVLEIMGRHPALRRYLGAAPAFPGQNHPWVKTLIAEIVADNVCREIARRVDVLRQQDERPDSEGFFGEHYNRMLRLLPRLHALMLPTAPEEILASE